MKKSNLTEGICFAVLGAVFLLISTLVPGKLTSLMFGFSSAFLACGIITITKYFYWSAPQNKARYEERLAKEAIELHDELKITLRDKSGRYAYILGLATITVAIVVFSVLGALDVLESRIIVLFLSGYLLFQYIAGILFFRHLLKRY